MLGLLKFRSQQREPAGDVQSLVAALQPIGIIDIGSNSVRLVVYARLSRAPVIMFNEKVMAGLGRGLATNGRLGRGAMDSAVAALARFRALTDAMNLVSLRVVATAAVREAENAQEFVNRVSSECGLEIETISGEAEARGAALGVIAGIPDADGVVGDLGGGSLELVRVAGGQTHEQLSLPIGALRLEALRKGDRRVVAPFIRKALNKVGWAEAGRGKPFYAVGGSWRALVHLHMHITEHPLPIVHQYEMPASAPAMLVRSLAHVAPAQLKMVPNVASSRLPALPGAAMLLAAAVKRLGSSEVIASGFGLREGLLFEQLDAPARLLDPLIEAARDEGARQGRFPEHGDMLFDWASPVFGIEEPAAERRIRHAASLLSDIAWRAHPDFRAERGVDAALHGNWVAITGAERAALAAALHFCFGGPADAPVLARLAALAPAPLLARARSWGLALRLGQRLAGGTAAALAGSSLSRRGTELVLGLEDEGLVGETVQRRLKLLASALELDPVIEIQGAPAG